MEENFIESNTGNLPNPCSNCIAQVFDDFGDVLTNELLKEFAIHARGKPQDQVSADGGSSKQDSVLIQPKRMKDITNRVLR